MKRYDYMAEVEKTYHRLKKEYREAENLSAAADGFARNLIQLYESILKLGEENQKLQ